MGVKSSFSDHTLKNSSTSRAFKDCLPLFPLFSLHFFQNRNFLSPPSSIIQIFFSNLNPYFFKSSFSDSEKEIPLQISVCYWFHMWNYCSALWSAVHHRTVADQSGHNNDDRGLMIYVLIRMILLLLNVDRESSGRGTWTKLLQLVKNENWNHFVVVSEMMVNWNWLDLDLMGKLQQRSPDLRSPDEADSAAANSLFRLKQLRNL